MRGNNHADDLSQATVRQRSEHHLDGVAVVPVLLIIEIVHQEPLQNDKLEKMIQITDDSRNTPEA
jgi:hypothetical protein